jgi:multiple antibiotic resistance protein
LLISLAETRKTRDGPVLKHEIVSSTISRSGPVVQPGTHEHARNGRRPHTAKVVGSNPSRPTIKREKEMSPDPTVDLVRATVALFIIVDPIGLVPIFSNVTSSLPAPDRNKMYRVVIYTGASLLTLFALVGQELLALFGISLPSFEMAGGLLLLLLALDILFRGERFAKPGSHEDVGIVPIAFPLLVGPGAITTTMIALGAYGILVTLGSVVIVMLLSWIVMKQTPRIHRLLGKTGSSVVAQVLAVFIAAIAIQFIITGIRTYP